MLQYILRLLHLPTGGRGASACRWWLSRSCRGARSSHGQQGCWKVSGRCLDEINFDELPACYNVSLNLHLLRSCPFDLIGLRDWYI